MVQKFSAHTLTFTLHFLYLVGITLIHISALVERQLLDLLSGLAWSLTIINIFHNIISYYIRQRIIIRAGRKYRSRVSRRTAVLASLSGSDDEHEDKEDLEDEHDDNKTEFSSPKFLKSKLALSGVLLRLLFFL